MITILNRFTGAKLFAIDTLRAVDLRGRCFEQASLVGADLESSDLRGCNMRDCDLSGANLACARLDRCDLSGATLAGAMFFQTSLEMVNMTDVDVSRVLPRPWY